MLGGGKFTKQNKILPGAYINTISKAKSGANLSERGYVAIGMELDWGPDGKIITISSDEFRRDSLELLGFELNSEKLKNLREIFKNAQTLYLYKLNSGGVKASNSLAEALYTGVRGNDIKISIESIADEPSYFNVITLLDNVEVDRQKVKAMTELKPNAFVIFKSGGSLQATSAQALVSGTNGTVNAQSHKTFLDLIESYEFNILAYAGADESLKDVYINFTKRLRDDIGAKFQFVLHNKKANYEGVINVKNDSKLVYWVSGASAACEINKVLTNKQYDGEYEFNTNYTQTQLEKAIRDGEFVFHKVRDEVRVLTDINSLTTVTEEKNEVFKENQTVRIIDQIAVDIAGLFNTKVLGKMQNDKDARESLWAEVVKHHEQMQKMSAISDFKDTDVVVEMGEGKKSVVVIDTIKTVNAMEKLYMTVIIV